MIDSHCHFTYMSKQPKDIEDALVRANREGILYFIDIGVHPSDLEMRVNLLTEAQGVFLTAGFYPDYTNEHTEDSIKAFKLQIETLNESKKRIFAVGEIGLDYAHDKTNKPAQRKFFAELINVAKETDLPIVIHSREAFNDTFTVLRENENPKKGIFHCFSGGMEEAKRALDLGYILSFSGVVTYEKNDFIREACKYVPSDMFTLETDSPYLTPQKLRGRRNEPSFIPYIAEVVAECRNEPVESVLKKSLENAQRVLGFPLFI